MAIIASSLFVTGLTLSQGFFVGPAHGVGAGALCSSNARRLSSRCRREREATQQVKTLVVHDRLFFCGSLLASVPSTYTSDCCNPIVCPFCSWS